MKKAKWPLKEEKFEDTDIYDDYGVEVSQENDEISDEEAAFMNGYMEGDEDN